MISVTSHCRKKEESKEFTEETLLFMKIYTCLRNTYSFSKRVRVKDILMLLFIQCVFVLVAL